MNGLAKYSFLMSVSGFCSREQIYRPENCGICRAVLIGKAGSGFWEGGKGTRNRALMSRKGKDFCKSTLCKT